MSALAQMRMGQKWSVRGRSYLVADAMRAGSVVVLLADPSPDAEGGWWTQPERVLAEGTLLEDAPKGMPALTLTATGAPRDPVAVINQLAARLTLETPALPDPVRKTLAVALTERDSYHAARLQAALCPHGIFYTDPS